MVSFRNTIKVNASPEQVWAVLGDLASVDTWIPGITKVEVDGYQRICTFADGSVQHEEISDYSKEKLSYRYSISGGPLPLKTNRGQFRVEAQNGVSLVIWDAEFEVMHNNQESQITGMLENAYQQVGESLRQLIETKKE